LRLLILNDDAALSWPEGSFGTVVLKGSMGEKNRALAEMGLHNLLKFLSCGVVKS